MVKCAECGFLAVRNITTRALEEAEEGFRKRGAIPLSEDRPSFGRHEELPLCFAGCHDLQWEIRSTGKTNKEVVITVINDDRQCGESFTKWQLGFTPKEHREMLDRQWMRDFQNKRDREDREWREKQRQLDLEWREEQDKKAEKRHRWDLIVLGIIVTLIISFATIASAFIARGSWLPTG